MERMPGTPSDRGRLHLARILSLTLSTTHVLSLGRTHSTHLDHLHLGLLGLAFGGLERNDADLLQVDVGHGF